MARDTLKAIKEFFYQFENLRSAKITPKTISDGYLFMQFLSNIDCHHFDTTEMSKPPSQMQKSKPSYEVLSTFVKLPQNESGNRDMDLMQKMKNWKLVIRKVKQFFHDKLQKGIKYGDIDLVDICKNSSMDELSKVFELILCVVAQCDIKDDLISKIMLLEESTQSILAITMQEALKTRICSIETQERMDLIEELQLKQQEISSLYAEVQKLQQLNSEYLQKIEGYEKSASKLQYEKQKMRRHQKRTSLLHDINNPGSDSFLERSHEESYQADGNDESCMEDSFTYHGNKGAHHIIESLKNRLMKEEQEHENEVDQLHEKIYDLEDQLNEKTHFEELLVIYQEKYQEALAYVEKVTQYEKEKNKICQEIIEKDIIIEELKATINEINERLIEVEEEKIDLEILLAKKNNERLNKHKDHLKKEESKRLEAKQKEKQQQLMLKTSFPTLLKQETALQLDVKHFKTHSRQISQTVNRNDETKISLSLYPYYEQEDFSTRLEELQIKTESQSLQIKRLQRKEKQMTKNNNELKGKLDKMRKIQNENKKLASIIVELNTRKNQETQILVSCLHETFLQYDFKFHKLIGDNFTHVNQPPVNRRHQEQIARRSSRRSQFNDLSNLSSHSNTHSTNKVSGFNATFNSQQFPNKNKEKRCPSIKVDTKSEKQILEVSITKEETQNRID